MKEVTHTLLQKLAGDAAFGRGLAYFEDGAVLEVKRSASKIIAAVQGNELYQVTLIHTKRSFEGSCDCPASDNFDFCKHCVAAALHYVQETTQLEQAKNGPPVQRLSAYLKSLDKNLLVSELSELIQTDKHTLDAWSLRADAALGLLDHKAIRKRITAAIPYSRHLFRYQQVQTYFAKVETLVDQLPALMKEFKAEQALELVDYALTRINKGLETVDDSGGFRFDSLEYLHQIHFETVARLDWPAQKLAAKLVEYYFSEQVDMYPDIPAAYMNVIDDEVLDSFQKALEKYWEELPPLKDDTEWEQSYRYMRIARPLIETAEAKGDIDRAIELKAKVASGLNDFMRLSEYCFDHQRIDQATQWLNKAKNLNQPSYHKDGINELQIKIWIAEGKPEQAYDLQWQAFHKDPSVKNYQLLKQVAEQQKASSAVKDCEKLALDFLQQQIVTTDKPFLKQTYINVLVTIYLLDGHSKTALTVAEKNSVEPGLLLKIADANSDQPDRVLPIYIRYADNEVKRATNQAYQESVAALKLAKSKLGDEAQGKLHQEVVKLWAANKAKRNFVKLLREAFPGLG